MIAKHPGIEGMKFSVKVTFEDGNEYEIELDLHEMHRLVVSGQLPASVKEQAEAIRTVLEAQELEEEATEE